MTASRIEADRISVVLFDLGGVVFTFDWQRAFDHWARAAGGDAADLADRFSHGDAYQRFERGELSPSEYFSLLRAELAVDLGDEDLAEGWNAIFGDLVPGITETIAAVRESPLRIAALSNTNATHATMFSRWFGPLLADLGRIFAVPRAGSPQARADRIPHHHRATRSRTRRGAVLRRPGGERRRSSPCRHAGGPGDGHRRCPSSARPARHRPIRITLRSRQAEQLDW